MDLDFNFDDFKNIGISILRGIFIGIISMGLNAFLVFFPSIFLQSSVENGILKAIFALGVSSAILAGLSSPLYGGLLFFLFAPMVLIFHYCYANNKSYKFTFFAMFLVLLASALAFELGSYYFSDFNFSNFKSDFITSQMDLLKSGFGANVSQFEMYEDTIKRALDLTFMIMPSFYFIGILLISYFSYVSTARSLLKKGIIINQPPIFAFLSLPRNFIVGVLLALIAVIIFKQSGVANYVAIYYNLIAISIFLLFINGLSFISFLLLRYKMSGPLKFILFLTIVIVPVLSGVAVVLGFFDMLFQFRKKVSFIRLGSDDEKF